MITTIEETIKLINNTVLSVIEKDCHEGKLYKLLGLRHDQTIDEELFSEEELIAFINSDCSLAQDIRKNNNDQ